MEEMWSNMRTAINRRSFVKNGLTTAGLATAGAGLLLNNSTALAEQGPEERSGHLTRGDAALLRFAAAAEIPTPARPLLSALTPLIVVPRKFP